MFCPECKAEYRDGFFRCADCDVDLVDELPAEPEPEPGFVDFEEVLRTYNPADIAFIKSILDGEDIGYFFKGEHFLHARPLADPARLMVRSDQAESARALLEDLDLSFMGISLPRDDDKGRKAP